MAKSPVKIAPGRLRHTVKVQRYTESRDSHQEVTRTWGTLVTRKASIQPLRGEEYMAAQTQKNRLTHRVRMRYYAGLTTRDRLKFGDRIFNVASPPLIVDERNWAMEVMCREVT